MSTRACIARMDPTGAWAGRYHHTDGYPSGLGRQLWRLLRDIFDGNTDRMLRALIDDHPAGWSSLFDRQARCYCHGDRHEPAQEIKSADPVGAFIEWVYAIRPATATGPATMTVFALKGGQTWTLRPVAVYDLSGPEPGWAATGNE